MKKIILFSLSLLTFSLTLNIPQSFAETKKTIHLNDGSVLRGEVLSLQNGVYTVKTGNLGTFQLHESRILSISTANPKLNTQTQNQNTQQQTNISAIQPNNWDSEQVPQGVQRVLRQTNQVSQNLPPEAKQLQSILLSDPELMSDIQNLASDPAIAKIMGDPQLMNALMSGNIDAVGNNKNAQILMNNPKIQRFMEKFGSKVSSQR